MDFQLNAARRRNVTLRFARIAARRLLAGELSINDRLQLL
jgi:hypothetical protein